MSFEQWTKPHNVEVILTQLSDQTTLIISDMSGLPRLLELNLSFCLIHYLPEG